MATQIRLYYNTFITPEKNACVEDIATYLQQKEYVETTLNKFIQHDLSINLKLDTALISTDWTTGDTLNPFQYGKIDYAAIKNEKDGGWLYYYVLDGQWTATRTVTLSLALDTMTSFQGCYEFTDKTLVTREHKDRFINELKTIRGTNYYPRKFYLDGDDIQPVMYKQEEDYIEDYDANTDWYLMYVANNTTGATEGKDYPVNAYVVGGNSITVNRTNYQIKVNTLDTGKMYFWGGSLTDSYPEGSTFIVGDEGYATDAINVIFYEEMGSLGRWKLQKQTADGKRQTVTFLKSSDIVSFTSNKTVYITNYSLQIFGSTPATTATNVIAQKTGTVTFTTETVSRELDSIETVDRTDTRLISLIKLPYCPVPIDLSEETPTFPSYVIENQFTWQNENAYWYLQISSNYLSAFEKEIKIPADLLLYCFVKKSDLTEDVRKEDNESALYRSQFFNWKFTYDSFSYPLQYELLDEDVYKAQDFNDTLKIKMVTTSTMNSRFLFDFNNNDDGFVFKHTVEDYPNILSIARNNNVTTFNSEYVNYMRNGYNYDVKAKNAALTSAGFNLAGNVIGLAGIGGNAVRGIANIAKSSIYNYNAKQYQELADNLKNSGYNTPGGNVNKIYNWAVNNALEEQSKVNQLKQATQPISNVLAIGQMTSAVGGIVNNVNSILQTERNFEQKQQQMKNASVSVSGSDDIDLLSYYSKNRMKIAEWKCSDRMRKAVGDLYYYQGYATQEQKVPTHNNRKWFDFLQCNANLNNIKNVDQRFIEDIKDRLAIGVTYYHHSSDGWDINQTKGNNETWIA